MHPDDNPLLQPEDFMAGYKDSIEDLKNKPELVAMDKLSYEVFSTDSGKKWIENIKNNYLLKASSDPSHPNFKDLVVWMDGFKQFGRMILEQIHSHQQRIDAGK